ncbi:cytochrome c oxidase subunit 4 [Bradyrhizobium sp. 186]|uniref:cytochrome c oxidase subunit 4 n=1 Tax=Bradyrhizobium sp. 186 TaxID=2782654 RepID=UPI00200144F2|nr:cytochrome c oxidase subunit 4 [Bradyrhizobium sp. 186]UPK40118.1 cytochrome c oxidase subunit 4 [Bradyrhizobium sp. 186]
MLSRVEYPHWLMLAGAVLVLAGLIGWAFQRNLQKPKDSVREPAVPKTDQPAVEPEANANNKQ